MKKIIKIVSLLLALLMCASILIGCKKEEEKSTNNGDSVITGELSDKDKRALEKDNLPDWVSTKYEGQTITTYSYKENFELDTNGYGELTGSTVHDLIYTRNMNVENRLGITLDNRVSSSGNWRDYGKELGILANSQSDTYSIIYTMGNSATASSIEHMFFSDVTQLEYLSIDSAWWNREAMENQSFDGKTLRYLVGDITLTTYNKAGAIFVNSVEYNNRYEDGMDGLYDLVIAGKWTIDVLLQKSRESALDYDSNGVDDDGNDFIGFGIGHEVRVKALEYGFDIKRWSRDDSGFVVLDYDIGRADIAVSKLKTLIFDSSTYWEGEKDYLDPKSFAKGHMLFYENQLGAVMGTTIRNMEENFGIVPTPKLDENQEEYTTEIQESSTFVVIPETCIDKEFASVVVEALCAESYRRVVLPYIEECLKIQYVRDSRSGQNIDIVLKSATKDYFGLTNPGGAGKIITTAVIEDKGADSCYNSVEREARQELKDIKDKYYS